MIVHVSVDVRSLLAWTNNQIVAFRRAIRHRHDDDAWWASSSMTPGYAQAGRAVLRRVAHLLHVERAHARGRIHGNFESLEKQREWLARWETRRCGTASRYLQVVDTPNLVDLREGRVVQERATDEPGVERDGCARTMEDMSRVEGIDARVEKVQS